MARLSFLRHRDDCAEPRVSEAQQIARNAELAAELRILAHRLNAVSAELDAVADDVRGPDTPERETG